MRSDGCEGHDSQTWDGNMCVKHGTCNVVCQREGYDRGRCYVTVCRCYKNCTDLPIQAYVILCMLDRCYGYESMHYNISKLRGYLHAHNKGFVLDGVISLALFCPLLLDYD